MTREKLSKSLIKANETEVDYVNDDELVNRYKHIYCSRGCDRCPIVTVCPVDGENEYDCDLESEKYIFSRHHVKYENRTVEELLEGPMANKTR